MEFGAGHARAFHGSGPDGASGDVPMALGAHPTALQALESAVALPDVYTAQELQRTLRRHRGDVMRAALQLREKHAFREQQHYSELHVGLSTVQTELRKGYVHFLEHAGDQDGCPIVLLQLRFFRPSFSSDKLQRQGVGAADGSSSLEDTRRLCVYMLDLAVEAMEEKRAPGVVFLVDLAGCALANLEAKMVTDLLMVAKQWYPETVRHVFVVNGTAVTRALALLLSKVASERTQQRIRVLQDTSELRYAIPAPSLPEMYGGQYKLMTPVEWMALQAEIEGVELDAVAHSSATMAMPPQPTTEHERALMSKDARQLNGMQYAACSVDTVVEMKTSVLRGPLFRNKSGVAWVKLYAILRPEALLLYETVTSSMPQIIIPVNEEVRVEAAHFADAPRGASGFRVLVPGVAGGHLLAAGTETERGNWLQEIQLAIDADAEEVAHEKHEEEKRLAEERAFAKLNMISFDDVPDARPAAPPQQQQQQQHPHHPTMGYAGGPPPAVFPSTMMQPQAPVTGGMTVGGVAMGGVQFPRMNMMNQYATPQQQQQQQQQQFQQLRPPQPVVAPGGMPFAGNSGMMMPPPANMVMGQGGISAPGMMMMRPPSAPGYPMNGPGAYGMYPPNNGMQGGGGFRG
jgi:hypothetical protein